jgi:hypothetical protein
VTVIKNLSKRQIISLVLVSWALLIAGFLIASYVRPNPGDILTGTWKKVSVDEDISLAFYADGNAFSYNSGKRTFLGKYRLIDRKTIRIDYYMINSSYCTIIVLARDAITITDEKGRTAKYIKSSNHPQERN